MSAFPSVAAREIFQSYEQILRSAPIVAHVQVEGFQPVGGAGLVYEFTVNRIEELRGRVPGTFRVRLPLQSRVVDPDGAPDPVGSQWILLLEKKAGEGHYLLHSLNLGKIELMLRSSDEQLVLARPLPDPDAGGRLRYYSLPLFRAFLLRLAGK